MSSTTDQFSDWLDGFFQSYYCHHPVNATFIGVHDYDNTLPDCSETGLVTLQSDTAALGRGLRLHPEEGLSESQTLDRQMADGFLKIQEWELSSGHFQMGNPAWYTGEMVFGVMALFLRDVAPLENRVEAAASRMRAIPEFLKQARQNVRSAPQAWSARSIRDCDGAFAFFSEGIDSLIARYRLDNRLRDAADVALLAVEQHREYLTAGLMLHPSARYSCGADAFSLLMRHGHFLEMTAADILHYAEDQAATSEALLRAGAPAFGATNWQDAVAGLGELHPTAESYYHSYQEVWNRCRETAESRNLLTWPDYPVRYIPRPEWSRNVAPHVYFLYYRSPAPFDRVPIVDYLVTPIEPDMPADEQAHLLRANNDSAIKLNHVVHHGSIGHHVQNWHAFRARARIGQIAAVDCASRIAVFSGGTMAEGWACYATELMREAGFLTPLECFSQHHARLRMAARAIVDVKLHCGEFTIEDAAAYYRERVGMHPSAAMDEAVKNSMFPGAAMIYLMGADLIHELRRDLAAKQGPDFDLRAFHDRFLSYGSVPVQLISNLMREDAKRAQ